MAEENIWRSASMEGKWKDGKGDVALRLIEYYGKVWFDLRIINVSSGKNQHTRHGVRLTLEQVQEILPRIQEALEQGREMEERQDRNDKKLSEVKK